jgi:hypothetical protein
MQRDVRDAPAFTLKHARNRNKETSYYISYYMHTCASKRYYELIVTVIGNGYESLLRYNYIM